jgi:GAF domain-containing protein
MFTIPHLDDSTTAERYRAIFATALELVEGERFWVANCANIAALLYHALPDLNWAGFYVSNGEQLVLGPFQGKPACLRIEFGRGVCGTAAAEGATVVVPDVHAFPGHIACDAASRSEIVIPILVGDTVVAVLDLDSPVPDRFSDDDRIGLERLAELLTLSCDWPLA